MRVGGANQSTQQKKKPEREADSEDGVQCETLSRAYQMQKSVQTIERPLSDRGRQLVPSSQSGRSFDPGEFTAKGIVPINRAKVGSLPPQLQLADLSLQV